MHFIAYLFPLITLVVLALLRDDIVRSYPSYLMLLAVSEGLVGLVHALLRYVGKTKEYLSGYVVRIRHFNAWTERVVRHETVSDGKGRTRQVTRVEYVHHPEYWDWVLNTGSATNISCSEYRQLAAIWQTPCIPFNTSHINCVSGGGGQAYDWNGYESDCETVTFTGRYSNPLQQSNSIFKYERLTREDFERYHLYDYPDIRGREQDVIVGPEGSWTPEEQRDFHLLNALYGYDHEVHFFVLLYDADATNELGVGTVEKQRAWWKGGNKNEFTVCIGLKGLRESRRDVVWAHAFSWMDSPVLAVNLETWIRENPQLDLSAMCYWLRGHIDLWKRKEFKDFDYIHFPMNWWQLLILYLCTVGICVGILYVMKE